jgi:nicotinate-nucleotide pyrophosphorylase (carboxylating)
MKSESSSMSELEFTADDLHAAEHLIKLALAEDLGTVGDLTTQALIPPTQLGTVHIKSRKLGIVCGSPLVPLILKQMNSTISYLTFVEDGQPVNNGTKIGTLKGPVAELLTCERTCLNFMTHLSGIATLTAEFVQKIAETKAVILDTRKTHPGYRRLEKYAVRAGGAKNHRMGLYDAMMIKDNHRDAWHEDLRQLSLAQAVEHARKTYPNVPLIVEVDTLPQFAEVLSVRPDVILLDNMSLEEMRQAVELRNQKSVTVLLEASGGVNLDTVREIALTGVDRISVGAITHSAMALDLGFDWGG